MRWQMATLILRTLFYTSCSVACGLSLVPCWAAEYYVSPIGNDTASGTLLEPFASVDRAQQAATAGDTIWIRGGVYEFSGTTESVGILFDKSGQAGSPIQYFAYPGETPVFDFYQLQTAARIKGFSVTASWIHMKGLEVRGVQQILTNVNESWGIRLENGASNNVFEQLNLHHNEGPGFFIADGGNNLVINSDSHHNYDPDRGGENADGFGSHSNDDGNTFIGNRAWYNSDDGFDLINSPGIAYIEDSWAFLNGFVPDTQMAAGNGAGFKAGGFGLDPSRFPTEIPRHRIFGNLAFQNRVQGFYSNHHPGGIDWLNNTAVNNARNFDMLADVGEADHYLRNNLAYGTGGGISRETTNEIDDAHNSWNLQNAPTSSDFLSTSAVGVDGPRQADGSLPFLDFMRLAPGSRLIDAGEDVGLDYAGSAPDLGAFEFGLVGDYNGNGTVDAADYTIWKDSFGSVDNLRADGNENGVVDAADYTIWKDNFGLSIVEVHTVPEPHWWAILCAVASAAGPATRRKNQ